MVSKRSVSLDDDVARRIETVAAEDGVSFSAWLSAAAQRQLRLREGLQGVAEWESEAGALTAAERAAGEALLDGLLAKQTGGAAAS
ncbi:hypothetical protein [Flexivirga oryzae]|uniref:Fermentation-respiration switch protein FrsA (DUF1100 family) n=1 Tax=Flexivirga oryzae TaxID=1794944 RepID=A0A839N4Q0_9MICO|nr:hypothetical protein [Flexivirga oryzae]MBB2890195.1 fermentation-respiration switch protein FrsA (DUF1100 family) [Flexivirga oryzae]